MENKEVYIYESPDGGKTIFKRKYGEIQKYEEEFLLSTSNPSTSAVLIETETIKNTPNDAELGAKVRSVYHKIFK